MVREDKYDFKVDDKDNFEKVFKKEIELFRSELEEQIRRGNEGKYVMYCGGENRGVFEDYKKASDNANENYNGLPFVSFPIWNNVEEAIECRSCFIPTEKPLKTEEVEEGLRKAS